MKVDASNTIKSGNATANLQQTSTTNKTTAVDNVYGYLNEHTPNWASNLIPEDYLRLNNNRNMLNNVSVDTSYANLPKKNGALDLQRINKCRKEAIDFILKQNNESYKKLNYGCYKENLDSTKPLTLLLGPEIEHAIDQKADLSSVNEYRFGMNDLFNKVNFENQDAQDIKDKFTVKPAHVIRDNIQKQNEELQNLLKMDLSNEENIKEFLTKYQQVTGTGFSCDLIENAIALNETKDVDKAEKLAATCKAFGLMENVVETTKNNTQTDATFAAERMTVSGIMQKNPNPIVSAIGFLIPTAQLANDKLTEGCEDGEIINTDNITYENFVDVASEGMVEGLLSRFSFGGNFAQKMGKRTAARTALSKVSSFAVRAATPNVTDATELLEFVIPGQHLFRTIFS